MSLSKRTRSRSSQWNQTRHQKSLSISSSSPLSNKTGGAGSNHYQPISKNDACQQIGVVNKGLDQLGTLPTLSLKLDALTLVDAEETDFSFEILCRNVQERPPVESFNEIKSPFLPCIKKDQRQNGIPYSLDDPFKLAHVLTSQYDVWKTRVSNQNLTKGRYENVRDAVFYGCDEVQGKKSGFRAHNPIQKLVGVMEENPLGLINLYSSPCLIQLPQEKFAYCDHTPSVTVCSLDSNRKTVIQEKIRDEQLGSFSKVYGIKFTQEQEDCLVAMKYMDGISIQLMNNENTKQISRILSKEGFCDMSFLPYLDAIIAIDIHGNIILHDFIAQTETRQFPSDYKDFVSPFQWTQLDQHPLSPYWSRVLTRKSVSLFDVRKRIKQENSFNFDNGELSGGMVQANSSYQIYACTNLKTILIDERYTKIPLTEWYHPNVGISDKMPAGITSYFDQKHKFEYVATYWPDSDVSVICNDWKHSICQERLDSDTSTHYSCKSGKEILYPLSRGKPMKVPSMKSLSNEVCFDSNYVNQRLFMPWTGLTMFEKNEELKLLAVNAVSDLFEAVIHNEAVNDENEIFDTTFDNFDTYDQNPFSERHEQSFGNNSTLLNDEFLFSEHIELPVDSHRLNWLRHKPLSKFEKQHLSEWESTLPRFQKISFVTSVYQRNALPIEYQRRHEHTIKELKIKKVKKITRNRDKKEVPAFKNCPSLKAPDLKEGVEIDSETANVIRIFEDKPLMLTSDFDTSTTDDEDDTKSMRSRQVLAKRRLNLTPGLPEDTTYSMREFMHGLDPEMTSTQQSQFETTSSSKLPSQFDPSSTQQSDIFAETFFGDESQSQETELEKTSIGYETMSRTSSKKQPKKKKKRATIGF